MIKCNKADFEIKGTLPDLLAEYGIIATSFVMMLKEETPLSDELVKRYVQDITDSAVTAGLAGDVGKFGEAVGEKTDAIKAEIAKTTKRNKAIDDMIDDIFDEMFRQD